MDFLIQIFWMKIENSCQIKELIVEFTNITTTEIFGVNFAPK
jgi:hypothetical protein